MKKLEELSFPSSLMRTLVKEIDEDINLQKGASELLSKCSVLSISFLAVILKDLKNKKNKKENELCDEILKGIGIKEDCE